MVTDNFRDNELAMTSFKKFAMNWGPFNKRAVINVRDPKDHDFHHSWSDACDQIRLKIVNAQLLSMRCCFLLRQPSLRSKFKNLSRPYTIDRNDGKLSVKGHLAFLTIEDLRTYEYTLSSKNKISRDECAIQYHLAKISSILGEAGVHRAHIERFASSQFESQLRIGKCIFIEVFFHISSETRANFSIDFVRPLNTRC